MLAISLSSRPLPRPDAPAVPRQLGASQRLSRFTCPPRRRNVRGTCRSKILSTLSSGCLDGGWAWRQEVAGPPESFSEGVVTCDVLKSFPEKRVTAPDGSMGSRRLGEEGVGLQPRSAAGPRAGRRSPRMPCGGGREAKPLPLFCSELWKREQSRQRVE